MIENKKGVIIGFILLILVILGLLGYIVVDKFVFVKKTDKPSTVIIGDKEVKPESFYQIYNVLTKFDRAFNYEDSSFYGYVYKSKKLDASEFSMDAAIYATIRNEMTATTEARTIPESLVKNHFDAIFGDNLKYEATEIPKGDNHLILYNQDTGYAYISNNVVGAYTSGIQTINNRTSVEEGAIIVTRKVFYVEYIANESGVVTTAAIYNDMNKQKLLGKLNVSKKGLNEEEILGKYSSKLSTYNFIFKENSKNSNVALYRIEKLQ